MREASGADLLGDHGEPAERVAGHGLGLEGDVVHLVNDLQRAIEARPALSTGCMREADPDRRGGRGGRGRSPGGVLKTASPALIGIGWHGNGSRSGRRSLLRGGAAGACLAAGWPFGAAPPGDAVGSVLAFHERTKHLRGRAARGPGRVEWRTQPDPFRRFEGAALLPLATLSRPRRRRPGTEVLAAGVAARRVDHAAISQVLFDSLSLSAWKERGPDWWSLRVNPSSGNLHPTEAYLAGGPFAGLSDAPALLHYAPREHGLELRARLPSPAWAAIAAGLPGGALLAGLSVIEWRERWKYGERAWRYTLLDIGHAVGALSIAAAALGWRVRLVETWPDRDVARLLGVDRQEGPEAERAEALLALAGPGAVGGARAARVPAPGGRRGGALRRAAPGPAEPPGRGAPALAGD